MVEDYNSKIRSEGLKLMEKKLVSFDEEGYKMYADFWTHQVYIHGVVDFNDYPNQNITVFQALNIDWDLLLTFNIRIKDLDLNLFNLSLWTILTKELVGTLSLKAQLIAILFSIRRLVRR